MAHKIDWQYAYEWFMEDTTRSYSDVATQFGITKRSVERNAVISLEGGSKVSWTARRRLLGEKAQKNVEEKYKKSTAFRTDQHLLQYRNLQIILSAKISAIAQEGKCYIDPDTKKRIKIHTTDAKQLLDVAKALKIAIDGERTILGLVTSIAAVKPDSSKESGGWGELLALAVKTNNAHT